MGVGIGPVNLFKSLQMPLISFFFLSLRVTIESRFSRDVIAFSRATGMQRICDLDFLPSLFQLFGCGLSPASEGHGDAPMRHRTLRIILRDLSERSFGCLESE